MTLNELILNGSGKVRRDSNLMAFYIEAFQTTFGYKPACTSCTFGNDWQKLLRFVNGGEKSLTLPQSINTMKTFKLKKVENKIRAYRIGNVTFRKYDNLMTDDFAIAYLTNGSEAELLERKKLFAVLPEALREKAEAAPEPTEEVIFTPSEKLEEAVNEPIKKTRKPRKGGK